MKSLSTLKTRLLSFLLAVVMILSSVVPSYAMDSNAGGTSGSGVTTGKGGDFGCNVDSNASISPSRIGIRLSLVDNTDPSKVISVDDSGNPRVLDLLYTSMDKYIYYAQSGAYFTAVTNDTMYSTVKTQDSLLTPANGGPLIKRYYYDSEFECTDGSTIALSEMQPWMVYPNDSYDPRGEEFVDWCMSNSDGVKVLTSGNLGSTVTTININGVKTAVTVTVNEESGSVSIETTTGAGSVVQESTSSLEKLTEEAVDQVESYTSLLTGEATDVAHAMEMSNLTDFTSFSRAEGLVNALLNAAVDDTSLKTKADKLKARYETAYDKWSSLSNFDNIFSLSQQKYLQNNLGVDGYDLSGLISGLSNLAAGFDDVTVTVQDTTANIQKLLTLQENGSAILKTQSMIDKKTNDISQATEDWVLLVEPIMYLTICHYDTMGYASNRTMDSKLYGTLSNIMRALASGVAGAKYASNPNFNHKAFKSAWWALHVDSGFTFANGDTLLSLADSGLSTGTEYMPNKLTDNWKAFGTTTDGKTTMSKSGWGVNLYWSSNSSVEGRTWDEPTPYPAAPPASQKVTENGIPVVKWYVTLFTDNTTNTTKEIVTNVIVDHDHPRKILAENEGNPDEGSFYLLEKWATGTKSTLPSNGDTSTTFEEYHAKNPGKLTGNEPAIVEVPDSDQVLYLKLVDTGWIDPTEGDITVIKVKEPSSGDPIIEQDTASGDSYDPTEDSWEYIEDIQTPNEPTTPTKWDDVPKDGTPGTKKPIPINPDTKTIYIRYKEGEATPTAPGTMILYQDELSYPYTLRALTADGTLAQLQEYFASKYKYTREWCDGHECEHEDDDGDSWSHTVYCSKKYTQLLDGKYTLAVTSSASHLSDFILDYAEYQENESVGAWSYTGSTVIKGGNTKTLSPNAKFLFIRNKTKDVVTLYPGKNDTNTISSLNRYGISVVAYMPDGRRASSTGSGNFYDTFTSNFTHSSAYDNEASWYWKNSRLGETCYHEETWNSTEVSGRTLADLNKTYSNENNAETRWLVGAVNTATSSPSATIDTSFTNVYNNNTDVQVAQDGKLEFYPYTKMKAYDANTNATDVYVTSTNLSSMPAYTKIEAGVWKNGANDSDSASGSNPTPNVNLTSTQWSTHKSSTEFMSSNNVTDQKSVLAGGAIFDVDMKKPSSISWGGTDSNHKPTTSTQLGYRIWQTCIDDSLAGALNSSSTAPTLSEANAQVDAFIDNVLNSVASYGLVQAASTGIVNYSGYLKNFLNDSAWQFAYNGADWMSITLNEDSKYYLKLVSPSSSGSSEADVTNFGVYKYNKSNTVYTVKADTDGNVYVLKNGSELAKITKTQNVSNLLSNSEVKMVDDATKAITNFVAALDRNLGSNRSGATWYNEAFDGITINYTYLTFDVGLGNGATGVLSSSAQSLQTRSTVLDPFLTGKQESKSDMYNFNDSDKVRSHMVITGQVDDSGNIMTASGDLGAMTLKSGSTMQVSLDTMETFAYTKMFYIPNANVTDLN